MLAKEFPIDPIRKARLLAGLLRDRNARMRVICPKAGQLQSIQLRAVWIDWNDRLMLFRDLSGTVKYDLTWLLLGVLKVIAVIRGSNLTGPMPTRNTSTQENSLSVLTLYQLTTSLTD